MDISRRSVLRAGGALAVGAGLSGLAACSGSGSGSGGGAGAEGSATKGDITVWSWASPAAEMKALVPAFNAQYPDIKVTVQDIGNPAIWDKITTGLAAGGSGLADVMHIGIDYLPGYTEKFPNGLADLGRLGADTYKDAFAAGVWESAVGRNGKVSALPMEANSGGFYYRSDIFEQAGVDVKSIATWDDAIEAGKVVKAKTGKYLLGLDKPASIPDAANFFQMLLQLQGAFYFDLDGGITLDSAESVKAMTIIKQLNDAGLVADLSGGWNAQIAAIKAETCAVLPMPTWYGGIIEDTVPDQKGKWGVRLPPAVRRGGSTAATVNSTYLSIAGSSKQQAAAWKFVEFVLTRPENLVKIYKDKGIAPALMKAYDDPVFHTPSEFFGGQQKGEVFLDALKAPSPAVNYSSDYARALKVVTDAQTKVLLKGADPAEVLKQAADQLAQQTGRRVVR
ncbi:ABC transporter substrate-binding protein [Kitasatospora cineracea]|uniref:Carbohydrate ABC transporter substrate-binding protein (CUT1 family) n=1 Tax=Kitasatospora cineracea TaxID=88074 RepID=A0A8G1ULY7_9ACTN|nr:sugar ABC transporter substrate-binding protein [Kitasatospora cineracea]ROR46437.1 carbohydrate ABC transporter substrate-binding protein (CUT1 family) [Kitasatospora cineracea]